jgi:hypothetical protein
VQGNSLTPVTTAPFRIGGFFPEGGAYVATVPGVPPGAAATFRVRVWETSAASYENAVATGLLHGEFTTGQPENDLYISALGPPPGGPLLGPDLYGIQPLTLMPEPTAAALLSLAGFFCLSLKRRKNHV